MKIIDKVRQAESEGRNYFSFEYFPPRTDEGVDNLFERMDRMVAHDPLFCDITWGAGGSTSELTLDIASKMQNMICVETMMHLTCTNITRESVSETIRAVKKSGIQNILALRGDPPKGQDTFTAIEGGFACALDLVKYIRAEHGDYFGITVAGYPEAHPDSIGESGEASQEAYQKDLHYLKQKIDAGGDMIVTQLFYDVDRFLQFVKDCRLIGINCPIVPGIMPINNYNGFKRMTGFCKTKVPKEVHDALEPIKDNEEAVKAYGIHLGREMCKKLVDAGVKGFHLYTLNLEKSVLSILQQLGFVSSTRLPRALPWRPPTNARRHGEDVRPIFWANRPKSYISRTVDWDDFPHGRWGDSRSPAFGTLADYQFMKPKSKSKKIREQWGVDVTSEEDIFEVFERYCAGEITAIPWSESDGLQPESKQIDQELMQMNKKGFLTINSQPRVNGAPSDTPGVGWGRANGYVYQKAYVEFFTGPERLQSLLAKLSQYPSLTYHAVNCRGDTKSNVSPNDVTAVTWGVFPGKEVIQPTIVDPKSFMVWKDEAFDIWISEWSSMYPDNSESKKLIERVHDTYWLVNIVDNDYVRGDMFAIFRDL
eukprot:jgi/Chlat1/2110/Chrsp17S02699